MNWDHPIHSFTDPNNAEPHTPTRTPSGTAFPESFHTPKLESSFYDPRVTWNTADPYASSPDFPRTPQRFVHGQARRLPDSDTNLEGIPSTTFVQPQLHQQREREREQEQEQHFSPILERRSGHVDLPQDATATATGEAGFWSYDQQDGWPDLDNDASSYAVMKRSAASMQTPPPTSSSRRKLQNQTNPQTPRASTSAHFNQETPTRGIGLSPDLFGVQASSGLFQLPGHLAATTSPFFSQQQQQQPQPQPQPMPWDQEPDLPSAPIGPPDAYGDPFTLPQQQSSERFDSLDQLGNSTMQPRQGRLPPNPNDLGQHGPSASAYLDVDDGRAVATSFFTSPRVPPTHDEDPAMFLSSPARRFGFQASEVSPVAPEIQTRQPYHFQTEESERNERERELRKFQRTKSAARRQQQQQQQNSRDDGPISRPHTVSGRSSKRPSVNTAIPSFASHGRNPSLPSSAASGSLGPGSAAKKSSPSKGRLSPVKAPLPPSHSRSASAATVSAPMESVVLKVGKDGRAKTEMITQPPPHSAHPDLAKPFDDSCSTESQSDLSDNDAQPVTSFSQDMSFNVPDSNQLNSSVTRGSSRSRPHSKSSSYSSTVASSHSGRHSPWAGSSSRGGGKHVDVRQREGWMQQRRHSINPRVGGGGGGGSRGPSSTDSDATQEEAYCNENDESGDAQHALMKVLKQRSRPASTRKQTGGYRTAGRAVQPPPPPTTLPSSPPVYRAHQEIRPKGFSSPAQATDHHPTPKPGRHSNPISGTRCVCNSKDNGGHLMIQCEACTHWLHTKCVGLDRQSLPAAYVCIYCAQTPKQAAGHLRDSASAGGGHPSSPLARKSFQTR